MKIIQTTAVAISLVMLTGASCALGNSNEEPAVNTAPEVSAYTVDDVKQHATKEDCWTIINDKVYDITVLIPNHPTPKVVEGCGVDGTGLLFGTDPAGKDHSEEAIAKMEEYLIGDLQK